MAIAEIRDWDVLQDALKDQGWNLQATSKGHVRAFPPKGGIVHFGTSGADPRAIRNAIAELKRNGFEWPPPKVKKNGHAKVIECPNCKKLSFNPISGECLHCAQEPPSSKNKPEGEDKTQILFDEVRLAKEIHAESEKKVAEKAAELLAVQNQLSKLKDEATENKRVYEQLRSRLLDHL